MGLIDELAKLQGVTATGGGYGYDPTQEYNMEVRFAEDGTPYNARAETPLIPGHTRAGPMFNAPSVEVPTEPSLLNYGENYYSGTPFVPQDVSPTIQSAVNPTQEQFVGTPTGVQTQHGRDVYKTATGENVSEISVTVPIDGKWVNASSIHNGVQLSEDQVVQGIKAGVIQPTSVHDDVQEAITVAQTRSDNIKIDPMSLYNRQGRADYTPQDTYNPNTIWGDPSLESLPDPTTDAYAEQDYYAEQDRQAKIEAQYQALLKAQGIKEEELESYNIPDPREALMQDVGYPTTGPMSPNTSPDTLESLLKAKTLENRSEWDMRRADDQFNNLDNQYDVANQVATDDFGNELFNANEHGQTRYDINAIKQESLDNLMMKDREPVVTPPVVAPTDNKPNYPSHLTPYAIKMLEEQRKRNEMFQGIGDTATGIYEGAKTLGSDIYDDVTGFDYKGLGSDIYKEGADAVQGAQDLYQDFTKPDTRTHTQKIRDAQTNYVEPVKEFITDTIPEFASDVYDSSSDQVNTVLDWNKKASDAIVDVGKAIPGAYSRGVGNMVKFGKTVGNVALGEGTFDENDGGILTPSKPNYTYPMIGEGAEVAGSYLGGATAGVKLASQLPNLVKYVGAIFGGTTTTDPTEQNFSTMIQDTDYRNALTEYLMADTNAESSSLEKLKTYGKNFLEEGILGGPIDAAILGYQAIKNNPNLKAKILEELGSFADQAEGVIGKIPGVQTEQTVRKEMSGMAFGGKKVKPLADVDELGFYSKAEQALIDLKQEKNLPEDIITYLKKKGVTQGELEDTGLLDMLLAKKKSGDRVTREGLLDYIGENKVKLHEYQKYGASEGDALDNMGDFELDDPTIHEGADGGNMSVVDDTDYIYSNAEDLKHSLSTSDEYEMARLFEYLHKSDPEKYPKTIDMQIEEIELSLKRLTDADREVLKKPVADITLEERRKLLDFYKDNLGNPHEQAIMLPTEDIGIYGADGLRSKNMDDIVTEINTFFGDSNTKLIDLQNQRSTTNGYTDDWAGQIGKKIDDGNIDNLDFNIDDATYAMSEEAYLENPFYEWNLESGYTASGNEDIGIVIKDPDGDYINVTTDSFGNTHPEPVYSLNEANIQINENAYNAGYLNLEGDTLYSSYTQPGMVDKSAYREIPIMGRLKGQERFTGAHMNEDDVVAWLRTSDRVDSDGKRVLFIEEVQSDWHQQGRKRGYNKTTKAQAKGINRRIKEIESRDIPNAETMINVDSVKWNARLEKLKDEMAQLRGKLADIDYNVPNAPLKNEKWQEMAVARAMKIASEEGYDRVVFANAKQQLDNWNPSRRLNDKGKVEYEELYTNIYDNNIPSHVNKYAKKYGTTTGKTKLDFNEPLVDPSPENITELLYIDVTPKGFKKNIERTPLPAAFAFPIGGGLLGGEETKSEELKDGILKNVKSWKPNNNLVTFVKTMENDPLRVGNVKVKEYDDVGHKAKGYGTKSGLLAQDTEAEASKAMSNKLVDANKAVDRLVKIDLNKNQRNALVSLVYNVGATGFGKSNALKELNKGNIKAFLKEAFDPKVGFVRTKGKIVKGLVNRRAREKMIFTKGNYGN
jgi:GH24 family phage-related lysozyme (muramidase)